MSKELVNRLADHFLCHEDIDIKETTLYLLQYILNLDRKEFSKDDVIDSLKKVYFLYLIIILLGFTKYSSILSIR